MKPELASLPSVAMTTAAVSSEAKKKKGSEDLWPEAPPTGGIHRSNLATRQPGNLATQNEYNQLI